MSINKVILGDETLMDVTDTTAEEESVLEGYEFYGANGEKKTGVVPKRKITDTLKEDLDKLVSESEEGDLIIVTNDEDPSIEAGGGSVIRVFASETRIGHKLEFEILGKKTIKEVPSTEPYIVEFSTIELGKATVKDLDNGAVIIFNIDTYSLYSSEISLFDYKGWLESAGISDTFGSLENVLSDEKTIRTLMNKHASVNYLVDWLEFDTITGHTILNNDLCAKWINLKDYALDTLYSNATVKVIMDEVDKYGYGEWALVGQVPTMTSNTTPSGEVIGDMYVQSTRPMWKSFDGDVNTVCEGSYTQNHWIGYKFTNPVCVRKLYLKSASDDTRYASKGLIQYSDDGTTWNGNDEFSVGTSQESQSGYSTSVSDNGFHLYWRVKPTECKAIDGSIQPNFPFAIIQFYAWQPKGNVPIMTSNNAPYGEVIYGSNLSAEGRQPYYVFDGRPSETDWNSEQNTLDENKLYIGYKFVNPTNVKRVALRVARESTYTDWYENGTFKVMASNDNSNWELLADNLTWIYNADIQYFDIENDNYYLYYKIVFKSYMYGSTGGSKGCVATLLQFYGRELKVSVPTMTSNTEPWGVASGNPTITCWVNGDNKGGSAYWGFFQKAYKDSPSVRSFIDIAVNGYIQYEFPKAEIITHFTSINNHDGETYWVDRIEIKASNDNSEYVTLKTFNRERGAWRRTTVSFNEELKAYKYFRIYNRDTRNAVSIGTSADFFGLDYSEHDERHYIYDHGVEVEPITLTGDSSHAEKTSNSIYLHKTETTTLYVSAITTNKIDLTNYKTIRAKNGDRLIPYNTAYGYLMVNDESTMTSASSIAERDIIQSDLPHNAYLSIPSVNGEHNVGYRLGLSKACSSEFVEWWLE